MEANRSVTIDDLARLILQRGILAILILIPFHAFLTVFFAKYAGYYDALRLWKEAALLLLLAASAVLLWRDRTLLKKLSRDRLIQVTAVFIIFAFLHTLFISLGGNVGVRAIGFGLVVDLRMFLFMIVVLIALRSDIKIAVPRWVLVPAAVVVGFGFLQMQVLPNDFLANYGYGPDTILPVQYVDNNPDFPRVQSTMRGANPLGAYLNVIILLLAAGIVKFAKFRKEFLAAMAVTLLIMFGTHSRSAWLGLSAALFVFIYLRLRPNLKHWFLIVCANLLIGLGCAVWALRDNDIIQNTIFHSSENSPSAFSSNDRRANALLSGVKEIARQPLGGGIGSAGPASVHNTEQDAKLSENFFVQIGQELGLIGLALYIAVFGLIAARLWLLRADPVIQAILAIMLGLAVVNMLSHAFSDDTLAYVFGALLGYGIYRHSVSIQIANKKGTMKTQRRKRNGRNSEANQKAKIAAVLH